MSIMHEHNVTFAVDNSSDELIVMSYSSFSYFVNSSLLPHCILYSPYTGFAQNDFNFECKNRASKSELLLAFKNVAHTQFIFVPKERKKCI